METLVLPAQDQYARQRDEQNQRLVGADYYGQRKYEKQGRTATARASTQHERKSKNHQCLVSSVSPKPRQVEKIFVGATPPFPPSSSSSAGFHEGSTAPSGRKWHSMPCSLSGESNASSMQAKDQGFEFPTHSQFRATKHENGRNSRSDMKNRGPCHSALNREGNNKKRSGCDWKPVETGGRDCRLVATSRQSPEKKSSHSSYEMNMSNEGFAFSPPIPSIENWAGPAYSNSPPPSSLPLPKFSMRQMRSASLELSSASTEFSEVLSTDSVGFSSRSVPSSPREASVVVQGFVTDVASATKNLKRILNLDLDTKMGPRVFQGMEHNCFHRPGIVIHLYYILAQGDEISVFPIVHGMEHNCFHRPGIVIHLYYILAQGDEISVFPIVHCSPFDYFEELRQHEDERNGHVQCP